MDQWTPVYPPTGRYLRIIVTTLPDRRPSASPGHPISVPLVSGILVPL